MKQHRKIIDILTPQTLFAIGAYNLVGGDHFLSFRITSSNTAINYIKVIIDTETTFSIEFGKVCPWNYEVVQSDSGLYKSMLHPTIEAITSLKTSL